MKIGIVSDALGNFPAFYSVVKHMNEQGVDSKVSLGNTVGYCPYPNECVELAVSEFNHILVGRFDEAVIDEDSKIGLAPLELFTAEWTSESISESAKSVIENMESARIISDGALFISGTPQNLFGNIRTEDEASTAFSSSPFDIAFVGQTGVPSVWSQDSIGGKPVYSRVKFSNDNDGTAKCTLVANKGVRYIINVGSVGLPKDGDSRASYVIYDTEEKSLTYFRIPYSVDKTVGKMQQKSFPTNSWMKVLHGK